VIEMELEYSPVPERAVHALEGFPTAYRQDIEDDVGRFRNVLPRPANSDGEVEVLHGVEMAHHFVQSPGESETINWHYVEAGKGEPVVLLHGIPDSWYLWHHQIAALSKTHRVIAVDLKGYGQSDKRPGDYRHEGVAQQLLALLDVVGIDSFNLLTHDRGTVQGDWLAAKHPDRVLRYCRGEQHLYHFNPILAPQENLFKEGGRGRGIAMDPVRLVVSGYRWLCVRHLPDADIKHTIQEYSYPEVAQAVMRYFNSSTFHKEWIDRRASLLNTWTSPVLILQGFHSRTQPREWYENARQYIPNAKDVRVRCIDAGHFWPLENPEETTQALSDFLNS
jgi:pimeloyl-ACP methyl ester carboxylesterase